MILVALVKRKKAHTERLGDTVTVGGDYWGCISIWPCASVFALEAQARESLVVGNFTNILATSLTVNKQDIEKEDGLSSVP